MGGMASAVIHQLLCGIVHLWLADRGGKDDPPGETLFNVYPAHIPYGGDLLKGKRVKIVLTIEEA